MIEIPNKAYLAKTYFPRTTSGVSSTYMLKLESELTQNIYHFSGLTDESKSKNYYKFRFDASQLDDGEYNYYVIGEDDNAVLATGLLRIGEVQQDLPEQYNYNPFTDDESDNEIVQYYPHGNFKYRFQDKEFTVIENGEYIITADEGYDAIGQVNLTVDLPIDDYFNSGYTSGYMDGYQAGYQSGYTDGFEDGYESGFTVGYAEGYESGYTAGYQSGYTDGFADGYASGYTDGYQSGKTDGIVEQKAKLSAITVVENGVYERADGYSAVTVDLPIDEFVQSGYTAGYSSGKTDGIDIQKSKLIGITITDNGQYSRTDGYSAITVNVPKTEIYESGYTEGYSSGKTDGTEEQKAKLSAITIIENGNYTRNDGYSAVTVNLPINEYVQSGFTSGYNSGKTDGIDEQKSKLTGTVLTSNGTYTNNDGYSAVTVSVPSDIHNQNKSISATTNGNYFVHPDSGYSGLGEVGVNVNVPVQDYFDSGYQSGHTDGYSSGTSVGYTSGITYQKSLLISSAFTENGTYARNDGYSQVTVNVAQTGHTDAEMTEAYNSGKTEGANEQKAKLVTTAFTSNGIYTRNDGYSQVTVNVPSGASINNQTKSLNVTANGTHEVTYDNGFTGLEKVNITVNVPTGSTINNQNKSVTISANTTTTVTFDNGYTGLGTVTINGDFDEQGWYNSGKTDGIAQQKAKLSAITITENGLFTNTDGYSAITVNVPQSGETGSYNLTVNITSNNLQDLVNNASVTVSYLTSSTTKTYTGSALNFSILPGVNYTVSYATSVIGYSVPQSVVGTTTWKGSTSIEGYYDYTVVSNSALTFDIISGGTIYWKADNAYFTRNIRYSKNGGTWNLISSSGEGTAINVDAGDSLMFVGDNATYSSGSSYCNFFSATSNTLFSVKGNIMSLIDSTGFTTATTLTSAYTFDKLFEGCSGITDISGLLLPATTLTKECYSNLFHGCYRITKAPVLPATVMADSCYSTMFQGCSNLTSAPTLPATELARACYYMMFLGCTSLTSAPELPATTLVNSCYLGMFDGCTSLTTAPVLPATTLADYCYYMMFERCTNLNYIKCLATDISASNCTTNWVRNVKNTVAEECTFVKHPNMTSWTRGDNGIPTNWTIEDAQ